MLHAKAYLFFHDLKTKDTKPIFEHLEALMRAPKEERGGYVSMYRQAGVEFVNHEDTAECPRGPICQQTSS